MEATSRTGMILLEHLNINVGDWAVTERFHRALGCQRAVVSIHMNCGPHTQFHMPVEEPAQTWRGEITIAYTAQGLLDVRSRLAALVQQADAGDLELVNNANECLVKDPWGNRFRLREATAPELEMSRLPTKRPNTSETIAMGVIGLVAVTLPIGIGQAQTVANFYSEVFKFDTEVSNGQASIVGGPVANSQRIVFEETENVAPYTGDHFCMYIDDFEGVFSRCESRHALYVNPRFTFLDDSKTLEEAKYWQAFRILDVNSIGAGATNVLREEHEIRSASHKFNPLCASNL